MSADDPLHDHGKPTFGELLRQAQPSAGALFHDDPSPGRASPRALDGGELATPSPASVSSGLGAPTNIEEPVAPANDRVPEDDAFLIDGDADARGSAVELPPVAARSSRRRARWAPLRIIQLGFAIVVGLGALGAQKHPSSSSDASSSSATAPGSRIRVVRSTLVNGVYLAKGHAIDGGTATGAVEFVISGTGSGQRISSVTGHDVRGGTCVRAGSFRLDRLSSAGSFIDGDVSTVQFVDGAPSAGHMLTVSGAVTGRTFRGAIYFFGDDGCLGMAHVIATRAAASPRPTPIPSSVADDA